MGIWKLMGVYDLKTTGKIAGIIYTQSSVYGSLSAANYLGMNDGNASGAGSQTATNSETGAYIAADLGGSKWVDYVVIGYDYLGNLPGGFGSGYTEGRTLQGSNDNSTWTNIATTPTYSGTGSTNGLVSINVKNNWRYLRLTANSYVVMTEFQVWGY